MKVYKKSEHAVDKVININIKLNTIIKKKIYLVSDKIVNANKYSIIK